MRGFDARRFREIRKRVGYSPGELGRLSEVSPGTIRGWERGSATPQVDKLAAVAGVLGVSIAEILVIRSDDVFLADLRVLAGLTQPLLALQVGIATSTLGALELGEAPMSEAVEDSIAHVLGRTRHEVRAAYERSRTRPAGRTEE